jgi:hypothetical protein
MPADAILLSIVVCVVFLLFAFALAWADHTVSQWIRDKASAQQTTEPPSSRRGVNRAEFLAKCQGTEP